MNMNIYSITIPAASSYEWEISKLMNNPRFVFIAFKDTTNENSILLNNSKFVSFGAGNNHFKKSLQLFVGNVRYPIDPIKINEGTTNATRNSYPAFE